MFVEEALLGLPIILGILELRRHKSTLKSNEIKTKALP